MRTLTGIFLLIAGMFIFSCAPGAGYIVGQQTSHQFDGIIKRSVHLQYLLYLPEDYATDKKSWPMILFLHGMGERGKDLEKVKIHGPPKLIEAGSSFPFIVVSPQCPMSPEWSPESLGALLDDLLDNLNIDPGRIYLTGLSMGGHGTWDLALLYPERFAAIAPVCGWGHPEEAYKLKNTPVWVFHGARDPVVPLEASAKMVAAIEAAGGSVKFTVYPDAGHDSWTETYNNPELYSWFLSHKKS